MGRRFMRTSCRGMGRSAEWHDRDIAIDLRVNCVTDVHAAGRVHVREYMGIKLPARLVLGHCGRCPIIVLAVMSKGQKELS